MEPVEGIKLADVPSFMQIGQKLGDLLYHEGPLLSIYANAKNQSAYYLCNWTDCDEHCNRWVYFPITSLDLAMFFLGKLNLLELMTKSPMVLSVDLDHELNKKQVILTNVSNLPVDYLPLEDSFFQEEYFTEEAVKFKNDIFIKPRYFRYNKENSRLEIPL